MFLKKVEAMYCARVFSRCDDTGRVKYFASEEFPGLKAEPYSFVSARGNQLRGWFYDYPGAQPGRLVVFDHGLGGGHRSYMKEIEMIARHGYRVFAYDHTGCMQSEGEGTGGLSQSLADLNDCLRALKADTSVDTSDLSVMGHSWGGYAAMNIAAYHPDVKRVVAISGFISVEEMVKQSFPGLLRGYRKHMMALERASNPTTVDSTALSALADTTARVLLIHSRDDKTVSYKRHFRALSRALEGRENITLLTLAGRGHNPNYTEDAVRYKQTLYRGLEKCPAVMSEEEMCAFRDSYDWDRMTAQDMGVWEHIFACLDAE